MAYVAVATYVVIGLFHKVVWFILVFLIIYLFKYHMDKKEEIIKEEKDSSLIEE